MHIDLIYYNKLKFIIKVLFDYFINKLLIILIIKFTTRSGLPHRYTLSFMKKTPKNRQLYVV